MDAAQQVAKRTPKLIFDKLSFTFSLGGGYPFEQDDEVAIVNHSGIPVPCDPEGHYRVELSNRFTPRFPEPGEERNLIAVTIMKAIIYPSDKLKDALARNPRFNQTLAASTNDVMRNADEETRRDLFLRGIAAACAIASQENRILGAVLKDLFEGVKGDLAGCVATLLAIHIGTRAGDRVSRQLKKIPNYGPLNEQDLQTIARRLPAQYADFRIYHRTLKDVGELLAHIIETDTYAAMAPSATAPTPAGRGGNSGKKPSP